MAGSDVYLSSILDNLELWGVLSDSDDAAGSFEARATEGIYPDPLVGPKGIDGDTAPEVKLQWDGIEDARDLPANLTAELVDVGKGWWIGNQVYIWDGRRYRIKAMGTQGIRGPLPDITPSVHLLNPDDPDIATNIDVDDSDPENPDWQLNFKVPRGPRGINAPLRGATDYDNGDDPQVGQSIAWNGSKFKPEWVGNVVPKMFSIPESGFVNYTGITDHQNIAALIIPDLGFDWIPYVFGHIKLTGIELDMDPFILGCEARVGHARSGPMVARGYGNIADWATIVPHFSTNDSPYTKVPDGDHAVVSAGASQSDRTIYINLATSGDYGWFGAYLFNKRGAHMTVMCIPVSGQA